MGRLKDYLGLGPSENYDEPTPFSLIVGAVTFVVVVTGLTMLFSDESFVESLVMSVVTAILAGMFIAVGQRIATRRKR